MRILSGITAAILLALLSGSVHAQKEPVFNGVILKPIGERKVFGTLERRESGMFIVRTLRGEERKIAPASIRKGYFPEDITLYHSKRFHYKRGLILSHAMSFSAGFFGLDLTYSQRFLTRFELGAGTGYHLNSFSFSTTTDYHTVMVSSMPLYGQAKIICVDRKTQVYLKGRAGYANNFATWGVKAVDEGIMWEAGIGFTFISKGRLKHFVEFAQYKSNASGIARNWEPNAISDIQFDVTFYSFNVRYGIEFGR